MSDERTECFWCGRPPEGDGDGLDLSRDPSLWVPLVGPEGSTVWICPWCDIESRETQETEDGVAGSDSRGGTTE